MGLIGSVRQHAVKKLLLSKQFESLPPPRSMAIPAVAARLEEGWG